ncbi:hypothetical protein [Helicobacter mustelae]|uniref:hypothetical protein n=1 Tax=Helicobacter mustelae TaxID=217 RepID=UPI0015F10A66|nr:hypothetical protein [Helicobacter mustelae]
MIGQAGGLGGANNANANARFDQIQNYLQKFNDNSANATGMPSNAAGAGNADQTDQADPAQPSQPAQQAPVNAITVTVNQAQAANQTAQATNKITFSNAGAGGADQTPATVLTGNISTIPK